MSRPGYGCTVADHWPGHTPANRTQSAKSSPLESYWTRSWCCGQVNMSINKITCTNFYDLLKHLSVIKLATLYERFM